MIFVLTTLAIIALFWLVPIIHIASSSKVSGTEKLGWILAVVFVSWFAWIFFLIFAPIKKN